MNSIYQGKTVAVLGFGRSGRAAADFLLRRGAQVRVYERVPIPPDTWGAFAARGATLCTGELPSVLPEEILVRSPVIRPDLPPIARSVAAGSELTSEVELFLRHTPARVFGVTGSDGKTTTSTLLALILQGGGHTVHLGGNIGTPLLSQIDGMRQGDLAVLELSSFQLMTLSRGVERAVVTNLTPNHLDWHTDMAEYAAAKRRICTAGTRHLILNGEDGTLRRWRTDVPVTYFSLSERGIVWEREGERRECPVPDGFRLVGRHNRLNLAAAMAAAEGLAVPREEVLRAFGGVPHRLQHVDTVRGVRYFDSSIDTSPSRTAATLAAMEGEGAVILLAGGRAKGVPFEPMIAAACARVRALCLYGEAGESIARAAAGRLTVHRFESFEQAFRAAAALARAGDAVLLSPACTAFDQFRDFEARGETFCRLVQAWKREQEAADG